MGAAFRFAESGPEDAPDIAVFPFEDFRTAANRGILSDAVSESIFTALARFPQLIDAESEARIGTDEIDVPL
ncbi:hypothetical protein [Algicella marina]|uniref:Uncharacterized protein n=1 Tax=Algicella marina TaxID=2683284 RepID=A0A6P1T054_9RHOB|nr:hypothetical protein [Algicella marina]QHQ35387.1 hypothetical protein GO499_09355 [Algicella marina]